MKPYEQFVGNILDAVRNGQGKDPMAATQLIQQALASAGLMPSAQGQPAAQAAAQDGASAFVDLNAAPAWAKKAAAQAAPGATGAFTPPAGGKFAEWAERLQALRPGQGKTERAPDPRAPGQFLSGSFTNDAGNRNYRLYVPSTPAAGPRPLVVMLHGCKQNPEDFAAGTVMNVLAEEQGFLVLYPEQTSRANGSSCWNWFEAGHQQTGQGEPSIIAGMTREVVREHGGDDARVFVAGLSAGGAMAAIMGATYPELYRAVGVHSGLPVGSAHDLMSGLNAMKGAGGVGISKGAKRGTSAAKGVPTIVFHGDRDATVNLSNGEATYKQSTRGRRLREVEERGQGATVTRALDGAGQSQAEYWVLHGAGHAWSGGSAAGSYTDPSGHDASAEMLRFFLAQSPQ